jgi:hypothetical protein
VNQEDAKRPLWVLPNGNQLQETREFYLLVDGRPYVLPFHGTGHTTARKWQTYMAQLRHPKTGGVLPSYAFKYLLRTTTQSNSKGHHWFGVTFENCGPVSMVEYKAARELHAVIQRGAYRVEMPAIEAA